MDKRISCKKKSSQSAGKKLHGRYWYFVDNLKERKTGKGEVSLIFALPINHSGQIIKNMKIYPKPVDIIEDLPNGNKIIIWKKTDFDKEKPAVFYYDFDVYYKEVNTNVNPQKTVPSGPKDIEHRRYTISEGWLDITKEIRSKAKKIIGSETNQYNKAKKIFNWIIENISYEYPDIKSRGASKTLKKLKGDCGEFSALFVSLCRSVGIPARPVTCLWFEKSGHQWAEIYIKPYGWIPVDTSIANSFRVDPEKSKSLIDLAGIKNTEPAWFFGNLYPKRLIVLIGENIKVKSKIADISQTFYILQPGGIGAYPTAAKFKGFATTPVHSGFYIFGKKSRDEKYARKQAEIALAESYLRAKSYDKAESGILKGLKEKPKDASKWLLLGQVYMATQKYREAIAALKKSIAGDGGSVKPVFDACSLLYIGNCHDMLGNRKTALKQYQKVIKSAIEYRDLQTHAKKYKKTPYTN